MLLRLLAGQTERATAYIRLCSIEAQARVLDRLARARGEHDVGVQRRAPSRKELALDSRVLREPRLADLLAGDGELFEGGRERVLGCARVFARQRVRGVDGRAGDGVAEGLGLRLCGGGSGEGRLGFGRGGGGGEQLDFFADGAAQVVEGLADVGGVVVGFVGVLRAVGASGGRTGRELWGLVRDLEHGVVHLLQRVHALLELDVVGGQLGLSHHVSMDAAPEARGVRRVSW